MALSLCSLAGFSQAHAQSQPSNFPDAAADFNGKGKSGPVSGVTHPYRMIVESSIPIDRKAVCDQLGDVRVKIYQLNFGGTEVRQYVLSVESTLPKDDVISRLKHVPGVKLVSEDRLMQIN